LEGSSTESSGVRLLLHCLMLQAERWAQGMVKGWHGQWLSDWVDYPVWHIVTGILAEGTGAVAVQEGKK
jgi:hypothetical protein